MAMNRLGRDGEAIRGSQRQMQRTSMSAPSG
jgi:hypothetical protein